MTSDGQSVERLREYLRALKPEARAVLIVELERAQLRGDDMTGNVLVLAELRRTIRAEVQQVPRIGDAARLFCKPFEPFLIDAPADHRRIGRIARASLERIWAWIGRDLMRAEVEALSQDINNALLADDRARADQLTRALHDRAIVRMHDALAGVGTDERAQRRLAVQPRRAPPRTSQSSYRSSRTAKCWPTWRAGCRPTSAFSSAKWSSKPKSTSTRRL